MIPGGFVIAPSTAQIHQRARERRMFIMPACMQDLEPYYLQENLCQRLKIDREKKLGICRQEWKNFSCGTVAVFIVG